MTALESKLRIAVIEIYKISEDQGRSARRRLTRTRTIDNQKKLAADLGAFLKQHGHCLGLDLLSYGPVTRSPKAKPQIEPEPAEIIRYDPRIPRVSSPAELMAFISDFRCG
jgi:hypothetical protein